MIVVGSEHWVQACSLHPCAPSLGLLVYMKIEIGEGPDASLGYFIFVIGNVIILFRYVIISKTKMVEN